MINNKAYIGQSINPERRFVGHCSRAKNDSDNSPIHAAIKKYGKENFKLEILEWTENYNIREKELIKKYNTLSPNGYNIADGGEDPPHKFGENHHNSIISDEDVKKVIGLLKNSNLTEPQICKVFNNKYNQVMINSINWGITHKQEDIDYPIRKENPYILKKNEVEEIKWLLKNSLFPCSQIAEYYHVNPSAIKHINTGNSYYDDFTDYPIRKFRGKKQSQPVEAILAKRSTTAIDTQLEMGVCAKSV